MKSLDPGPWELWLHMMPRWQLALYGLASIGLAAACWLTLLRCV